MHHFLLKLNENTCHQMKELSLSTLAKSVSVDKEKSTSYLKLINALARFKNLTTLHILIPEIQLLNTRFLFGNIPYLMDLAVVCVDQNETSMWEHVKENCLDIKSIRVIGLPKDSGFSPTFMERLRKRFRGDIVKFLYAITWKCRSPTVDFIDVPIGKSITARDLFS